MNMSKAAQASAPLPKSKEPKAEEKFSVEAADFDGLRPELPNSLMSINQIVDNNERHTCELLFTAKDRLGAEVVASLDKRELALGRCGNLAHFAVENQTNNCPSNSSKGNV